MKQNHPQMIQEEISELCFGDRMTLKEQLGIKLFNQTLLGTTCISQGRGLKRANKNRPSEQSSKLKIPKLIDVVPRKKSDIRDPRFDGFCGEFDEKRHQREYKFIQDMRTKETQQLYLKLRRKSPDNKAEIKYLLQRMENQDREKERKIKRNVTLNQEKLKKLESLKQGRKIAFLKRREQKVLDLVNKFEEFQQNGKLKRHIRKKRSNFKKLIDFN